MKKTLRTALLFTAATTILLGVIYPLVVTGLAQVLFPYQANGQLIERDGIIMGSRLIGQPFSGPGYFHSRPSAAGAGYDASASGGSNIGPTNQKLVARVQADVTRLRAGEPTQSIPIDMVTASASGLDPHISLASAYFQVPRVARERGLSEEAVRGLIQRHVEHRQLGILGEPRINTLSLNLALSSGIYKTEPLP